jgi:hypothetical protein
MLLFIAPLNLIVKAQLIYRITDFHPECMIAERERGGILLSVLLHVTWFWRRRVSMFEALGLDQARRLAAAGIPPEQIFLKPDPSPVVFSPRVIPLRLPDELQRGHGVILYSGNWGIAHDDDTFIEAYSKYSQQSGHGLRFWLNATGSKADHVESELRRRGAFVHRSRPVPLEQLPSLLISADVHLITLRDAFVGYVLPSKVHACIASRKRLVFIGSERSDVHRLASLALSPPDYRRVGVGEVNTLINILHEMEQAIVGEHRRRLESARSGSDLRAISVA